MMSNTLWGTHGTLLYHSNDHAGHIQGQYFTNLSSATVI